MPRLLQRVRFAPVQYLPLGLLLQPFQALMTAMAVVAGAPLAVGQPPTTESVDALLPGWLVIVWGWELVVGGAVSLVGLLGQHRAAERAGLLLLGPAALVYSGALLAAGGLGRAGVVGFITLAFGLACLLRAHLLRLAHLLHLAAGEEEWLQRVALEAAQDEAGRG